MQAQPAAFTKWRELHQAIATDGVLAVCLSTSRSLAACGTNDGYVRVWRLNDFANPLATHRASQKGVCALQERRMPTLLLQSALLSADCRLSCGVVVEGRRYRRTPKRWRRWLLCAMGCRRAGDAAAASKDRCEPRGRRSLSTVYGQVIPSLPWPLTRAREPHCGDSG